MEVKEKNKKLIIVVGVLLLFGGISLAYFVSNILLNGNGANTKITTTANINGATINVEGTLSFEVMEMYPGHKDVSAIKVTATGNNELIPYNLIWKGTNTLTTPLNYTIYKTSEEINVTATCNKKTQIISGSQALSEECTISNLDKLGTEIASGTINKNDTKVILAKDEFVTAVNNGISYYYYVILEYPNLDEPQNYDLEGSIDGEVTVEESTTQPDINILAAYVVQEDGTYKEVEDIPQEGYTINQEKSTCSNGAVPSWSINKNGLFVSNLSKSGTSCYLYFDKYKIKDYILANVNMKEGTPDFNQAASTDEGVYEVEDGMYGGTSYYWRGAATTNYVRFANFCWRIVRINGDGSIRLIYDGTTCHDNGTSTVESITQKASYNVNDSKSNYVGWTYEETSQRPSDSNTSTASNAKTQLENWYNSNITGTNVQKVAQGKYCNDRNVQSGDTWAIRPSSDFYYAAYKRIKTDYAPTLSCPNGDVYTLNVGLITADEVMYAGGKWGTNNTSYYLYNGQLYWTMSPACWIAGSSFNKPYMLYVSDNGFIANYMVYNNDWGFRPVINLKADAVFATGGTGTLSNPYVIQ